MFRVDASKIRSLMFAKGIGIYELARQAQINATTTAKTLKDGAKVSAKTIAALSKFFDVDGEQLILKE